MTGLLRRGMSLASYLAAFSAVFLLLAPTTQGQAVPTATGPGRYLGLGGTLSVYQAQYGRQVLGGGSLFVDANPTWRLGLEGEARTLRLHSQESVSESTLLGGPRISLRSQGVVPYVKLLAGTGRLEFPFHYAEGDYLVLAPGAGVEYRLGGRVTLRIVDFEYQDWPEFSFGPIHPYGFSSGLSIRFCQGPDYPSGHGSRIQ